MKNTLPKYRQPNLRNKNRLNLDNLVYLNVQSGTRTSNRRSEGLDTRVIEDVKTTLKTDEYKELIRDAFGNESKRAKLRQQITKIISKTDFTQRHKEYLDDLTLDEVTNIIVERIVGLDVLEELRNDPDITDISCNGYDNIWVDHVTKGKYHVDLKFDNEQSYVELLSRFAFASDQNFSYGSPSFDAIFPQIRINVVGFDLSPSPNLQMRTISKNLRLSKDYMIQSGYMDENIYNLLSLTFATQSHLIGGETGTGKTELLRYFTRYTKPNATIIMIEDTPESYLDEIYPKDKFSIKMWKNRGAKGDSGTEYGYQYHLKNAMRQNPDYIMIQESRGGEALFILKAVGTGHIVNTTLHSKSAFGSVSRFVDLCQEGEMQEAHIYGNRIVSEDGFRIGIHLKRFGNVRRIHEVVEYRGFENGKAIGNTLVRFNEMTERHEIQSAMSPELWQELMSYHRDLAAIEAFAPLKAVNV